MIPFGSESIMGTGVNRDCKNRVMEAFCDAELSIIVSANGRFESGVRKGKPLLTNFGFEGVFCDKKVTGWGGQFARS